MTMGVLLLVFIVLVLFLAALILYLVQDKFVFHAVKTSSDYEYAFENDFEELNINTPDGVKLNAVLFKRIKPKGLLLYFHNHSGNIIKWADTAVFFGHYNYDVLLVDYRGYGKSTGKFDEQKMFDDSLLWYDRFKDDYDMIIAYGRGLGGTFAVYLAAHRKIIQLILEAPVYNLQQSAKFLYPYSPFNILLKYKFDASGFFRKISCPVMIVHGKQDRVVHYSSGDALYNLNRKHTELILIEDADHFNIMNHPVYLETMEKLLGE